MWNEKKFFEKMRSKLHFKSGIRAYEGAHLILHLEICWKKKLGFLILKAGLLKLFIIFFSPIIKLIIFIGGFYTKVTHTFPLLQIKRWKNEGF